MYMRQIQKIMTKTNWHNVRWINVTKVIQQRIYSGMSEKLHNTHASVSAKGNN